MYITGAADVPDVKLEIIKLWQSDLGRRMALQELDTDKRVHLRTERPIEPLGKNFSVDQYVASQSTVLSLSEMYWVGKDMTRLIDTSRKRVPDTILSEDDLPSQYGLVVFAESLAGLDAMIENNDKLRIKIFTWAFATVQGVRCLRLDFYDEIRGRLAFLGASSWKVGTPPDDVSLYPDILETTRMSIIEDRKLVHTFGLLLGQKVSMEESLQPNSASRHRSRRANVPEAPVRCVYVRSKNRPKSESSEHVAVDWSHRWVVSGHWRRQWYPSQDRHVPIFVAPYVKGPEDKELLIRPTVHIFSGSGLDPSEIGKVPAGP